MLAGLSDAELTDYYLQPETMYEYAGLLEEMHINGIDDARLFQSTKSALTLIGLSDDEQSYVLYSFLLSFMILLIVIAFCFSFWLVFCTLDN